MRELPYGNDRLTSKSNAADTRKKQKGGIAQLARASALQAEGRRFDSDYLHKIKTSFGRLFFCGDILRPPVAMRQPPGAYRCRLRRHRASPSSVFLSCKYHRACRLALQWRRIAFLLLDEVEMAASSKLIGPTAPWNATCPAR